MMQFKAFSNLALDSGSRLSNDEFILERIRFTLLESGNGKACMLNALNYEL